jgi:hypothetical protein
MEAVEGSSFDELESFRAIAASDIDDIRLLEILQREEGGG